MNVGIISAMPEEVQSLIDIIEDVRITDKGMRTYYSGTINSTNVVIAFSRWGKVASAITATQMINDFKLDEIIFTGVSGSLDNKLKVGDIVLGTKLFQHDMDTTPLFKKFEIPLLGKTYFETKKNNRLEMSSANFVKNIADYISADKLSLFDINSVDIRKGAILSGDQFISSKAKVSELKKEIPDALCVEMEGASVAQVCYEYGIPFSIIRIISDNANDDAPIDFPEFTKAVASKYAKGILEHYLN